MLCLVVLEDDLEVLLRYGLLSTLEYFYGRSSCLRKF
jgi:hypothetical protein